MFRPGRLEAYTKSTAARSPPLEKMEEGELLKQFTMEIVALRSIPVNEFFTFPDTSGMYLPKRFFFPPVLPFNSHKGTKHLWSHSSLAFLFTRFVHCE